MRDYEQERQDLERKFEQVNNKLDYLGIKGIEREREWQQLHRRTQQMVAAQFWIVVLVIVACGYYFAQP